MAVTSAARVALTGAHGLEHRSHKLSQKVTAMNKLGPEVLEKIEHKTLDVRAVVVLVGHDQHSAVPQLAIERLVRVGAVLCSKLEAEDPAQRVDLGVARQLACRRVAHVQELPTKRKHPVVLTAHHLRRKQEED